MAGYDFNMALLVLLLAFSASYPSLLCQVAGQGTATTSRSTSSPSVFFGGRKSPFAANSVPTVRAPSSIDRIVNTEPIPVRSPSPLRIINTEPIPVPSPPIHSFSTPATITRIINTEPIPIRSPPGSSSPASITRIINTEPIPMRSPRSSSSPSSSVGGAAGFSNLRVP